MTNVPQPTVHYRLGNDALTCENAQIIDYCDGMQAMTEGSGFSTVRALALLVQVTRTQAKELRLAGDLDGADREARALLIFTDRLLSAVEDITAGEPVPFALARAAS